MINVNNLIRLLDEIRKLLLNQKTGVGNEN